MEASNRFLEQAKLIDLQVKSPDERAGIIWNKLKPIFEKENWSEWDLICFCSQYLAAQSLALPAIMVPVRDLNRLIYTIHYYDRESDDIKSGGIGSLDSNTRSQTNRESTPDSNGSDESDSGPKRLY